MRPSDDAYAPLTAGLSAAEPGAPAPGGLPRFVRRRGRRLGAVLALLSGAILGACQGDNLWSSNSESLQPRIVGIALPSVVYAGDTLTVQVSAYGARQIASVEVGLAGAASFDTAVTVSPAVNVAQTFKIALPIYLADTALIVRATAHDKTGQISRMRADTAQADAPPLVVAYAGPDSIRADQTALVAVHAVGIRGVSKIRFLLHGAASRSDSLMIVPPSPDVTDTISFRFTAQELVDTTLILDMQAVDRAGLGGFITRGTIPVARSAPLVDSLGVPASVTAGTPLEVDVRAHGQRRITSLSFRLTGGVSRDSTVAVASPATAIAQLVRFNIPVDARDSVRVAARAVDASGLVGPERAVVVQIPTGAPVVDSLIILQGGSVTAGGRLDATVYAHGTRGISRVDLMLRNAFNADYNSVVNPPRTPVGLPFHVTLADSTRDSVLVVTAQVTDASGMLSAPLSLTLRVSDNTAPTVSATLGSSSVAAGRPASVRISARDNVGLSAVGARLLNAALQQIGGDSIVTSGRSRDTTLSVNTPLGPPANTFIVAFARDLSAHEGKTLGIPLALVDSSLPAVTINVPLDGMTYPIADSISMTVTASSLIGVKTIELKGVAIRGDSLTSSTVVTRFNAKTVTFPQPPSLRLPRDTTITRFLLPANDTTSEFVKMVATVTDSTGKKGVDTVTISVGGPRVLILTPVNGAGPVGVGTPFQLRVMAKDKSVGVDSITVLMTGVITDSIKWGGLGAVDSVMEQAQVTSPAAGSTVINVSAWNHNHIIGKAMPVTVTAATGGASDQQRPSIAIAGVVNKTRTELTDPIRVTVHAQDNGTAGLVRFGIVAYIARPAGFSGTQVDTVALTTPIMAPRSGWIDTAFTFVPRDFGLSEALDTLPTGLSLRVTAFAVDGGGYCGATASAVADSITCQAVTISTAPGSFYVPQGGNPTGINMTLVGGRSVGLPGGGTIADAVVDGPHAQLYLSNIAANRVDVLRLVDTTFVSSAGGVGLVGSQPWGLFLNGPGDTLFVANSGSTNISFVVINPAQPNYLHEDVSRRLLTPNEVLFEITTTLSNGMFRYTGTYYDFSDRPQFVAQDAMGRVIFSTKPTGTAPDGTLRYVVPRPPGQVLEPKLLFNGKAINTKASDVTAIAYVDSVRIFSGGASDDLIRMYDHTPGLPASLISNPTPLPLAAAVDYMTANGSDIQAYAGKWVVEQIGMSDTTFMAAAGDRGKVAFGEGAAAPAGRIMVWDGLKPIGSESLSNDVAVQDLLNNAAERVFGLGLNSDGSLGVARGQDGAYFFTPDLRLQGLFSTPGGAGGAAMHPSNTGPFDETNGLAFVSTPTQTIKILDSVHFFQRGEIALRDNVVGPVKAALPLAGENGVLAPTDPNYILVKLFAVTGSGSQTQVVILNVRNKDLVN